MFTFLSKIKCFLSFHTWIHINKSFGEKSSRYCANCRKEQETDYNSIEYQTVWMDVQNKKSGPKVKCLSCYTVIQSQFKNDSHQCKCKGILVSGGNAKPKITSKEYTLYEILRD